MIYNLALRCKGREEFIQMLKIDGFLADSSSEHPGGLKGAAGGLHVSETAADHRAALASDTSSGGSGSRSRSRESTHDDYTVTELIEHGPRDISPDKEDRSAEVDNHADEEGSSIVTQPAVGREANKNTEEEDEAVPEANGDPPPLSRSLAHKCAINDTIIVTWANYALWDFVKSWAHHVKRLGECGGGVYGVRLPSWRYQIYLVARDTQLSVTCFLHSLTLGLPSKNLCFIGRNNFVSLNASCSQVTFLRHQLLSRNPQYFGRGNGCRDRAGAGP